MANYMIARARVQDYSEWKTGYDAHEPSRAAAGLTEKHLLQDANDPNTVMLIFEAEDLKRAEEFSKSDDLREAMQKSGVLGKPDTYFLKD
ncbi:MAG: cyclase [Acidobacteria bacterium]|nr:cyclase [Acidobacteriota bacterium]MCA1637381.1 cyclase [Acidobacteriota bacterium]